MFIFYFLSTTDSSSLFLHFCFSAMAVGRQISLIYSILENTKGSDDLQVQSWNSAFNLGMHTRGFWILLWQAEILRMATCLEGGRPLQPQAWEKSCALVFSHYRLDAFMICTGALVAQRLWHSGFDKSRYRPETVTWLFLGLTAPLPLYNYDLAKVVKDLYITAANQSGSGELKILPSKVSETADINFIAHYLVCVNKT